MYMDGQTPSIDLTHWIRAGDTVMWGQCNAEPRTLTGALVSQRKAIGPLRVFVGIGASPTLTPDLATDIDFIGYSASGSHRVLAQAGVLDILPCHYSELPRLIRSGALRVDVVMLQLSPADENGRHSMGLANEYLLVAIETARVIIGEIHPDVPWVYGEGILDAEDVDLLVTGQHPPIDSARVLPGEIELKIAERVCGLVDDGCTLQLGIGNLPDAILAGLHSHRDLGLHTGAAGEGVASLATCGVLNNSRKSVDRGIGIAGILIGGQRLRAWAHRNSAFSLRRTEYTHNAQVLAAIDRLVAINSAVEVDLTGQINAEVASGTYIGAVGGAVDFLRGASASRGGMPIVALPASSGSRSRIVANLSGPVSTSRADAGIIVTEYGTADLRGKPLSRRVLSMLDLAAPQHRAELEKQAHLALRQAGAAFRFAKGSIVIDQQTR